jgi:hypothetical protein
MGFEVISIKGSENFHRVGYNETEQNLFVSFKSSDTYDYYGVPKSIFDGFKTAGNKDLYFQQKVKGKFRYDRRQK